MRTAQRMNLSHMFQWILTLSRVAFIMVLLPAGLQAQPGSSSKKAVKAYNQAENAYLSLRFEEAIAYARLAVGDDPHYVEAYLLLGDIYTEVRDYPNAIDAYKKVVSIAPDYYPRAFLIAGRLQLDLGRYQVAKADLLSYLASGTPEETHRSLVEAYLARCEFGIRAMEDPIPFDPVNLGPMVNSKEDEYINAITVDDAVLYLTMDKRLNDGYISSLRQEDFYFSQRSGESWGQRESIGPPINTQGNEGALVISPDGRYLLFSACSRPGNYGSCDIYLSARQGELWGDPVNLGPVINTEDWETQPSLSSDGRTLYFVSDRPGGKGGSDIWKSSFLSSGRWSEPVNLGDSINTPEDEMAPYIHPDNRTLYFSSRGHPGMGRADLFIARMDPEGSWKTPVNLGYPLNTFSDEINLIVDASGNYAYLSSNKLGGYGGMDIYCFPLYPEAKPVAVNYMKGIVFDVVTGRRLASSFQLIELSTGKVIVESFSDSITGEFLLAIPTDADYALNVSSPDYLFYSGNFSLSGVHTLDKPYLVDVPLQPIHADQIVVLKNIFFDTDRATLRSESMIELEKLVAFLNDYPGVRIEIRGHTDDQGTREHNDQLSLQRSRTVYDYLVVRGIDAQRLEYNGYGFSLPLTSNETPEGRQMNRRTEFRVIGNAPGR